MHYFGIKNNYQMAGLNDLYNDEKYVVKKLDNKGQYYDIESKKAKIK